MQIPLPSGAVLECRKISGEECILLAERASTASGIGFSAIIQPCLRSVVDPGPYSPFDIATMLQGDLMVGLVKLRMFSIPFGAHYVFYVRCQGCDERFKWRVNLETQLRLKTLPAASAARLKAKQTFHGTVTDANGVAHALEYHLQDPSADEPVRALMKREKRRRASVVESIAAQLTKVDGLPAASQNLDGFWRFVKALDFDELDKLRREMDDNDCGIDTEIAVRCGECHLQQDIDLPFGQPTFFRQPKEIFLEMAQAAKKGDGGDPPAEGPSS